MHTHAYAFTGAHISQRRAASLKPWPSRFGNLATKPGFDGHNVMKERHDA